MPFTPYHIGPALLVGLPARRWLHAPTLILASVAVDVEPLYVIVTGVDYPLHGYLHTFLGAAALGLLVGVLMRVLDDLLAPLWRLLRLAGGRGLPSFLAAGVAGAVVHVLLDAPLYPEMAPLYPLPGNPLYNPSLHLPVYRFCELAWLLGLALYLLTLVRHG